MKRHYKKIFVLSCLIFASALVLFLKAWTMMYQSDEKRLTLNSRSFSGSASAAPVESVLRNWPDPSSFQKILYPKDSIVSVEDDCRDKYRTILIYSFQIDYRKDPGSAVYNTANECVNGKFETKLDLTKLNLQPGDYYLIRADQGTKGSWRDPK